MGAVALFAALAVVVVGAGDSGPAGAGPAAANPPGPGPAVLAAPPATSPLLENHSPEFRATPTLVSGTEAYKGGEYLYQDHLYDDFGANTGGADPAGPASAGDVTYPGGGAARHGDNAADLVEFRISARAQDSVSYRFTLNTLLVPDSTMAFAAFDTDQTTTTGQNRLPRDPGVAFPGTDEVVTTWGTGAEHSRWDSAARTWVTTPVRTVADLVANQLTVVVPRSLSDPQGIWRTSVGVGLFDPARGGWLRPGRRVPALFNLGFRFDEPVVGAAVPPDSAQAAALATGKAARFGHGIDFDALTAGEDRPLSPRRDTEIRIFASALTLGEGRNYGGFPRYLGPLQPYSLTVPPGHDPEQATPFTLLLHSMTRHHWQYHGTRILEQVGAERAAVVLTPLARGVDGWYAAEAEFDTFEAWADAARHVRLDRDRVAVVGYSMGGHGAYRLASLYPDLFGRAVTLAAPTGDTTGLVASLVHVPFLNVAGARDRVVPIGGVRAHHQAMAATGGPHRYRERARADHDTFVAEGYEIPEAGRFIGEAKVERDPSVVQFVYAPGADHHGLGLIHDHAYWVSGLAVAAPGADGRIDARSLARGSGVERENRLMVTLDNLRSARLELGRAGVSTTDPLVVDLTADAHGTVFLAGRFPADTTVEGAPRWRPPTVTETGVLLPVVPGTLRYVLRPGPAPAP
jgi:pimeloyl-ACP methyl ester carboxylesterase